MSRHKKALLSLLVILGTLSLALRAQNTPYDPGKFTTGVFRGCPPEGQGGDPDLNDLKNRDLPPASFSPLDFSAVMTQLPQDLPAGKTENRATWSDSDRSRAVVWESQGVSIEGYLLLIRPEGPEACNCGSTTNHDYHMWLAASPTDQRTNAMVVEISPRVLPNHPNWNLRTIRHLIAQQARVRISGWLTWDQEHPEQIGKTRETLWEIHPIHKIEVFSAGQWTEL